MANPGDLAKMVPGFEFLQNLMKGATAGLPGMPGMPSMGQWVAPTLDPAELEKRIQELKTVQFWLDSNAKLLGATIQALEVQRMTLATLQTMNMPLTDLRDALKINIPKVSPWAPSPSPSIFSAPSPPSSTSSWPSRASAPEPAPAPEPSPAAARAPEPAAGQHAADEASDASGNKAKPAVDPLQWWGALTQQFTELATQAMKDTTADTVRNIAGAAARQAAAGKTARAAARLGKTVGKTAAKTAAKPANAASKPARKRS